jgi:hypothetical protein
MSLKIRNIRDLIRVNGRVMLLFHLVLSIVPERGCSSIEKLKEENVVEHYNA